MAAIKPLKIDASGQLANFQTTSSDWLDVSLGGTSATTATGARTALGLAIGSDVQAYSADTSSLASLSGTVGIPVRTSANTFAMRQIAVAARLAVTNPAGTAGDPTLDLATLSDGATGTFLKLTRDGYGRVSGTTAVVAADITTLVNSIYAPINNAVFTGTTTLGQAPTADLHAATKLYVDSTAAGQRVRDAVRVKSTANVVVATGTLLTIDGVITVAGDRVLLTDQTAGAENGVYIAGTGAWTRATDFDGAGEVVGGATFWVNEGTTWVDTGWTLTTNDPITVGTTSLVFTQSSALGQITAGAGLTKTGSTIDVIGTAGRIVANADSIDLVSGIVAAGTYTKVTVDTYGRTTAGATATPADIGAQPADAGLTSIAALTGAGSVHATATDAFVMRTLTGTAGRVAVTNGDGVAGNPTVDLASGVIATPGTYQSVTVDTYGRVTAGTTASSSLLTDSFTNSEAGTIVIGRAVYAFTTTDQVKLAIANAAAPAQVIGLVSATSIAASASGSIAFAGVMSATTAQWDVVTGQTGGLTPGAMYFLSNVTAGALTTTAPTTGYLCAVGRAMSTTKIALRFDPTIQL